MIARCGAKPPRQASFFAHRSSFSINVRRKTLSLNLEQKQAVVAEISAEVALAQAIVVAEYRGLPVGNMTELRKRARSSGVYLRVLKNTLARRAVADTPFAGLADQLVGPLAYGISADPVAVAKVLHDFSRENVDKFTIRGGAMPNSVMTPAQVAQLAKMPSRHELLSILVGTLQAPIAKLARTLNEVPGKFARTLAAVQEQKETQAA
jgi:large subunit ribosomal protein L10